MGFEAFNEGRISLMKNEWGIGFGSFQCEGEHSKVLRWNWTLEREQEQKDKKKLLLLLQQRQLYFHMKFFLGSFQYGNGHLLAYVIFVNVNKLLNSGFLEFHSVD